MGVSVSSPFFSASSAAASAPVSGWLPLLARARRSPHWWRRRRGSDPAAAAGEVRRAGPPWLRDVLISFFFGHFCSGFCFELHFG